MTMMGGEPSVLRRWYEMRTLDLRFSTGSDAPDREVVSFETVYQSIFVLSHVRIS
jgi:hypothetical protein